MGLESFNIFSLRDVDRIFMIGYKAAIKALITADFEKQQ
jgi:hypothetical protein